MTDYTKLVKALRSASTVSTAWEKLMQDAADAIEELQAENTDIREELFISQRKYDEFTMVASVQNAMLAKQLPKRGEWIDDEFGAKCSFCGKYAYRVFEMPWKSPFCPLCGAKMEAQE